MLTFLYILTENFLHFCNVWTPYSGRAALLQKAVHVKGFDIVLDCIYYANPRDWVNKRKDIENHSNGYYDTFSTVDEDVFPRTEEW